MRTTHRYITAFLLAVGVWVAMPACASQAGYYSYRRDYRDFERRAYDNGYRAGVVNGERDARDRRNFEIRRDRDYRDGDRGYQRGDGDRNDYRRIFRQAYEAGYSEGFNRFARAPGYGVPRVVVPSPSVVVPRGGYGYGYSSPASQIGYRDGLDVGRKDARDRERYDPVRSGRYRSGDHDYNGRYGSKDEYKREYRAAFERGYREGYGGRR